MELEDGSLKLKLICYSAVYRFTVIRHVQSFYKTVHGHVQIIAVHIKNIIVNTAGCVGNNNSLNKLLCISRNDIYKIFSSELSMTKSDDSGFF